MARKPDTAPSAEAPLAERLEVTQASLVAARDTAEAIAKDENANLTSDEEYASWRRRKRLAELEVGRLAEEIKSLEAAIAAAATQAKLDAYDTRYNAAADRNEAVAEMFQKELPRAWAIVSGILEAAALAEIETDAVLRARPAGYMPSRRLCDPEDVRRRRSLEEKVVGEESVHLWVDAKTGDLFADQSRRPTRPARQQSFRQITYLPARRGDSPLPFYRELLFPRIDANGPAMFDGRNLLSPSDVLRMLKQPRPPLPARSPQMRIEPMSGSFTAPSSDDGPVVV